MRALLKMIIGVIILVVVLSLLTRSADAQPPTHLPWAAGQTYLVTQGNSGPYSHNTTYTRYGWDFGLPYGAEVRAAAGGSVRSVFNSCVQGVTSCNGGWGNSVVVCYADATCSRYAHLASVSVSAGVVVTQSQPIGKVGSTGNSTAAHLHYQLESTAGVSLGSSFVEAGIPAAGSWVTSRNSGNIPQFDSVNAYAGSTVSVTAGDQVRIVVVAKYRGPRPIPCGEANFGTRNDTAVRFADTAAGLWPSTPWRGSHRVAIVGCNGYLNPGEAARWELTFRPPLSTPSGTYQTGVFAPVWEGVAWSSLEIPLALRVQAAYDATFIDQRVTPLVEPGGVGSFSIALKNIGPASWHQGEVFLGTLNDARFPYADSSWENAWRVKLREPTVEPGETGHFDATFNVPSSVASNRIRQEFALVVEGKLWFARELGLYLVFNVGDKDHLPFIASEYDATWVSQTYPVGPLSSWEALRLKVTYRNIGRAVLFKDGAAPVHLRGIHPQDRGSGFIDLAAPEAYEAYGAKLDQDRVDPGELFSFTVPIRPRSDLNPGLYNEYFRPVAETKAWFGPSDVFWPFMVS